MNAQEINQTFDLVSYVGALVQLHKSGAYYIGACPLCGGKDRFNIKRNGGDVWICRKCNADKYHSAIDFLMIYHNLSFTEALKQAGGEFTPRPRVVQPKPAAKIEIPTPEWQAEAWREVNAANDALLGIQPDCDLMTYAVQLAKHSDSVIGREARAYLEGRGITRPAWVCFDLGFTNVYGRDAIVLPYTDGQTLTGVKYRFLDDNGNRFAMRGGSKPLIFGMQNQNPGDTLVIVEGEINCISLWQVLPKDITVISLGGDTSITPLLRLYASRFNNVCVWMDESVKAEALRFYMARHDAKIIKSPKIDNTKFDANELLKAGLLSEFISSQLLIHAVLR